MHISQAAGHVGALGHEVHARPHGLHVLLAVTLELCLGYLAAMSNAHAQLCRPQLGLLYCAEVIPPGADLPEELVVKPKQQGLVGVA